MARYLVTGGAGFIGSHLCELLIAQKHNVCVLDILSTGRIENVPKEAEFIRGSIEDHKLVTDIMNTVDGCFHLAAIASVPACNEDWLTAHQNNLTGTLNILDSARANAKHKPLPVVFASSAAVYGDSTDFPLRESSLAVPISVYGVNKLCSEYYSRTVSKLFQVPVTALRLFNVYGPRQLAQSSYSGVITQFVDRLRHNEPVTIYGTGEQTRDFIFVTDVARFFLAAMVTSGNSMRIFNACSGRSVTIKQIAETLYTIFHKKPNIHFEPAKIGDINRSLGSPDLAQREMNTTAQISLQIGLERLLS